MTKYRNRVWLLLLLVVTLVATSCSGVPDVAQKRYDEFPGRVEQLNKTIDKREKAFKAQLKKEKYAFIASYSKKEQHADRFAKARKLTKQASKIHEGQVKEIVDSYEDVDANKLTKILKEQDARLADAKALSADPAAWLDAVVAVKANPGKVVADAKAAATKTESAYAALLPVTDQAKVDFAAKAQRIDEFTKPLNDFRVEATATASALEQEAGAGTVNYAVMTDYSQTVARKAGEYAKGDESLRAKLKQLPHSETHTLVDVRLVALVTFGRTTWNNSSDWGEEDHLFSPVEVQVEVANDIATFSAEQELDESYLSNLGVKTGEDPWPSDHDSATFWVDELEERYCQKIRVLVDGEPSSVLMPKDDFCGQYNTPSEVKDGIYWVEEDGLGADAIGMDVYSKAFGDFDDEASEAATPPGMAYVGDPKTGEWKTDNSGNSFWAFYGQYRFFTDLIGGPSPYYYRSEYDTWNKNYRYQEKSYYAGTASSPRFGAKSPQAATRFKNTNYGKTGLSDASVRSAGPAARGGGPGGGGK